MLVAALLVTGLFVSHFYSTMNMVNVMRQTSYLAIITIGEMLVFIVGGFDLSIGSIVALTSVVTTLITATKFTGDGVSLTAFGTIGGLIAAGLVGLVNGVVIALFRVASFIVTLATMGIAAGAALESLRRHADLGRSQIHDQHFWRREPFGHPYGVHHNGDRIRGYVRLIEPDQIGQILLGYRRQ